MGYFAEPAPGNTRSVFATIGVCMGLAWTTLLLRLWVRTVMIKGTGWDDGVLLLTGLTFTGYCAVVIVMETVGGASEVNELDMDQLSTLVGMVVASFNLYIATMIFFKISLAIFFLRIIIKPWQRYTIIATVTLNTVYGTFLFFIALFNCGSPSKYLEHELSGKCLAWETTYGIQLAGCIINAATDWIFALLPIFVLVKALMPLSLKISAGFVLLLGCCGSVVSLVRIQYISGLRPGPNFFNTAVDLCIWSVIECGLAIAAASSATLRPLLRGCLESARTTFSSSSHTATRRSKSLPDAAGMDLLSPPARKSSHGRDIYSLGNLSETSRLSEWSGTPVLGDERKERVATVDRKSSSPRTSHDLKPETRAQESVRECSPPPPSIQKEITPSVSSQEIWPLTPDNTIPQKTMVLRDPASSQRTLPQIITQMPTPQSSPAMRQEFAQK